MTRLIKFFLIISLLSYSNEDFLIFAHRGASQVFPENSLLAMENALGTADYLEMDLQMTKDNVLVVFHDKYLNNVTDVRKKFPKKRARKNGKYYVVDFTYLELQSLKITNRYYKILGIKKNITKYRNYEKYYTDKDNRIPSFQEIIDLVKNYNKQNNYNTGLYPELKDINFYKNENKDVSQKLIDILKFNDYTNKSDKIIIQSFDFDELKRLKDSIFPVNNVEYRTTYLIDKNSKNKITKDDSNSLLYTIKTNVDCLGVSKDKIYGSKKSELFFKKLKSNNMCVHVYTFNTKNVINRFNNLQEEILYFKENLKVDGIFKD